jgi:hypothetical protein
VGTPYLIINLSQSGRWPSFLLFGRYTATTGICKRIFGYAKRFKYRITGVRKDLGAAYSLRIGDLLGLVADDVFFTGVFSFDDDVGHGDQLKGKSK